MSFINPGQQSRNVRLVYLGFAFLISILYDVFFWNQSQGLGFLFFVLAYVIGFLILLFATKQFRQPWSLVLLVPALVMAADVVLFNNTMVHYWTPFFSVVVLIFFSIISTIKNEGKHLFSFLGIPIVRSIDAPFLQWTQMHKDMFHWRDQGSTIYRKIAIGIVAAMPLVIVFGLLFASADAVFANTINNIFHFKNLSEDIWRLFRTIVMTLFLGSFLYVCISEEHRLSTAVRSVGKFDSTIVGTILTILNALFLTFVFIQIKYLFGGNDFVLANGITFAEYARKGFFELAWAMFLAGCFLLAIYRSYIAHRSGKVLAFLQVLLVAQVAVIAVSALRRMNIYQDVYGFTVLRLYVEWFIYIALATSTIFVGAIITGATFRRLWHILLIVVVLSLTIVSSFNIDGTIAQKNITRYLDQGLKLDTNYINSLSVDAAPAVALIFKSTMATSTLSDYQIELLRFWDQVATTTESIPGFNLGAMRARDEMRSIEPQLQSVRKLNWPGTKDAHGEVNLMMSNY